MRRGGLLLLAALSICTFTSGYADTLAAFKRLVLNERAVKWELVALTQPAHTVVSYAFLTEKTSFGQRRNCGRMTSLDGLGQHSKLDTADVRDEARAAFRMWESAANIRFVETTDWRQAGIVIGAQVVPRGNAYADVEPVLHPLGPPQRATAVKRSLICLNPNRRWKIGFDGNLKIYDLRYVLAHEIGHAIGLDHPSQRGQLMSFKYDEKFRTLQSGDIRGAVEIYGPPMVTTTPRFQSMLQR